MIKIACTNIFSEESEDYLTASVEHDTFLLEVKDSNIDDVASFQGNVSSAIELIRFLTEYVNSQQG
jgi:hypothetical protein